MNTYQQNRQQKLDALQQAMQGNTEPLRQLQQQQGRPYTDEEIEQRRTLLGELLKRDATRQETLRVLGRYDKSGIPGKVCIEYAEGIYVWHN